LKTFQSAAANAIVYLQNQPTPSVELQTATVVGAVLAGISSAITDQFSTFQANFTQMQKARSECISEMIQIQASAWCFGCDPNFGTTGIEGFDLVYSDDLKQRVIDKCIYYLTYSYNQNFIYILYYSSSALEALAPTLQQISTGNPQAVTEFIRIINTWEVNLSPKTTALTPIKFPTDCNATDCAWLFEELFVNGTLNEKLIAAGGVFVDNGGFSTTSRRLKEEREEEALDKKILLKDLLLQFQDPKISLMEDVLKGRKLQAGTWNPDIEEAQFNYTFPENPGQVNNLDLSDSYYDSPSSSTSRISVFSFLMLFFIFNFY